MCTTGTYNNIFCFCLHPDFPGSGSEILPAKDDHQSPDVSDSGAVTNPFPLLVLLLIVGFVSLVVVVCSCAVQPLSAASSATVGELQACSSYGCSNLALATE